MPISKDSLGRDERVVVDVRTHAKVLILPTVTLLATGIVVGAGLALQPAAWRPWGTWVLAGIAAVVTVWGVLLPWLRWLTSNYIVTNRRIITRRGIITRTGHDLPLRRLNNVNFERGLLDRILGCGTLVLETAAGQPVVLPDVPDVERIHVTINELLYADGGPVLETGEAAHADD